MNRYHLRIITVALSGLYNKILSYFLKCLKTVKLDSKNGNLLNDNLSVKIS